MIDVVGSFGSRFSYATHAVELSRALKAAGLLGSCVNLDDVFLEDYWFLCEHTDPPESGRSAIVIAPPTEPIRAFAACYPNSALFVCPNTNQLGDEAIETVKAFDRIITPSLYCHQTVVASGAAEDTVTLRLGVHDVFLEGRRVARLRAERRRNRGEPKRAVHFTSDWFWPGRKGTEELLEAWPAIAEATGLLLTIHCVEPMRDAIYYHCADRGMLEPEVEVVAPLTRGSLPHELFEQMAAADLVIHPSRSEGFGMIALSALTAGVPLVTTHSTGEHLPRPGAMYRALEEPGEPPSPKSPARAAGWVPIGSGALAPLHGEEGEAPEVSPLAIRSAVIDAVAALPELRVESELPRCAARALRWIWTRAMDEWVHYARDLETT